jgi:hypothetical protein
MMASRVARWLMFLVLLAAAEPASAQDDVVQRIYASQAGGIRAEYESMMLQMPPAPPEHSGQADKNKELLKMIAYNKAAMLAYCAVDAEKERLPGAERVPSTMNLMLQTCIEIKLGQLRKFSQTVAYADLFFPDRIASCGERVRLRDQEKLLRPYDFLFLDEPRLYDFARYNECLMAK